MDPAITVFVPTLNPAGRFHSVLAAIQKQRLDRPFEVLVIDSGSTDGTVEFLRAQPVRLIEIPGAEFNHGLTRAHAIREAGGAIVVLTVQDAIPADDRWLQSLVDPFADAQVAGVYGRQVARTDASPFVADRARHGLTTNETPRLQPALTQAEFEALPPLERAARATFDNVNAAVRRDVALEIPFAAARFGEDLDWAARALVAGHSIVYEPRAVVIHSHDRSPWYEFKRVYLDHQLRRRLFGVQVVPNRRAILSQTAAGARHALRVAADDTELGALARIRWRLRAWPYSLGQTIARYLGARSVAKIHQSRFYRWIDRRLGRGV